MHSKQVWAPEIRLEADIIVNTDADNQYFSADIENLIQPILNGDAELVIGDRGVANEESFTPLKRKLQTFGSYVVSKASGLILRMPPVVLGHCKRYTLKTNVLSNYSYTLETIIQAGNWNISVASVPVRTNPPRRPSRLMNGMWDYLLHSGITIIRAYAMYRAIEYSLRLVWFYWSWKLFSNTIFHLFCSGAGAGHVQSVILAAVLLIVGFQTMLNGLLADLIASNRKLLEEINSKQINNN